MKSVQQAKRMLRENQQDFNQNKQMRWMYDCLYVIYKDEIETLKPIDLWHKIGIDFPGLKIKKTNFVRTLWKYKKRTNERDNKEKNVIDYTDKLRLFLVSMSFSEEQRKAIKELIKDLPEKYMVRMDCIGARHLYCLIEKL